MRFPGPTHRVVGFEHRKEAERFLKEFGERLAKFGLELHLEKTRLIEFGRYAEVNRKARGEGDPETFAFLGFTHRCGTGSPGQFVIWRQSERKRLEAKLQEVKQTLRARMHEPVAQVGEWLSRVRRGFYHYHGVPGNRASLNRFRERLMGYWWRRAAASGMPFLIRRRAGPNTLGLALSGYGLGARHCIWPPFRSTRLSPLSLQGLSSNR